MTTRMDLQDKIHLITNSRGLKLRLEVHSNSNQFNNWIWIEIKGLPTAGMLLLKWPPRWRSSRYVRVYRQKINNRIFIQLQKQAGRDEHKA